MLVNEFTRLLDENHIKYALVSGRRELRTSCPSCEHRAGHHLYMKILGNELSVYTCFRCGLSGVVNEVFLRKMFGDIDVSKYSFSTKLSNKNLKYDEIPYWKYLDTYDDDYSNRVITYINLRLGTSYTRHDTDIVKQANIIMNPLDFMKVNNIDISDYQKRLLSNGVCFISANKRILHIRNLSNGKRWSIIPLAQSDYGCYVMSSSVDIELPINVILCEGVFDVLSLRFNNIVEDNNTIWVASCGYSRYKSSVKYIISKGIFGDNVYLSIYVDTDKQDIVEYAKMFCKTRNLFNSIRLYVNSKYEDFGISKELIDPMMIGVL